MAENWDKEIEELENFFKSCQMPTEPLQLSEGEVIHDLKLFIATHISVIKTNNGKNGFIPYLDRLKLLKSLIDNSVKTENKPEKTKKAKKKVKSESDSSQQDQQILF